MSSNTHSIQISMACIEKKQKLAIQTVLLCSALLLYQSNVGNTSRQLLQSERHSGTDSSPRFDI